MSRSQRGKRVMQTVRRSPSPSSDEDMDSEPEVPVNPFKKNPNFRYVDFADFTIEVSACHIEEVFENMGVVSIVALEKHAYPRLVKDFYKNIVVHLRLDRILCLLKNKCIVMTRTLIRDILNLEPCSTIFSSKAHPTFEGYDATEACH